jgi:hypothetical protein
VTDRTKPLAPLPPRAKPNMSAKAYREAIAELDLSQVRAARFLGLSDRQGQRIARGEVKVPVPVIHLLRLMLNRGVKPGDLDNSFKPRDLKP